MAEAESAPTAVSKPTTNGESSSFQLDIQKLHGLPSEQQSLYLLTFTADLVQHVEGLDAEGATREQAALKKELLQIVNLSSPSPTRVIRNNLRLCFAGIFTKGNRKLLYESINDLVAIVQGGKDKDVRAKHAAVACLGALFEAAGDSAVSLSPLACTAILKSLKTASNDTGYRSAIFRSLGRISEGIVAALDEDVARSIWKQARNAASGEKSLLVQASACSCLEQLVRHTTYFDNSNDFEKLQTVLYRAIESSSAHVRHAAASCLAAELVKSFSESPSKDAVPRIRKPRKSKKAAKGEELDEELERASSPAPDKPATALSYTITEMLRILSTHYCRSTTTNKARAGIAVCYIKVFKALGESVLEKSFNDIARHLFTDILSHPSLLYNKYRQAISRKFVRVILERVICKSLGETAQVNACRFLINDIIKDYPQAVKERPEPNKYTLVGALSAVTALIGYLDAAIGGIADACREALLQVLQHPSFTVQVYASKALRAFVLACPQQLLPTVSICMNSVNRELNLLAGPRQAPRRCIGYAHGLAAVLSTSSRHRLYGSVDVYARVLQQATNLLKTSGSSDLRVSSCQLQVAWIMIGGLMSLGPNFVKIHLPQLMLLWKNALPRPVPKENMSQRNMIELSYLAHVRECALGSIRAFLMFNQRLLTSDVSKRLSAMLENTVAFLQSLPEKKVSDDPTNRLSPALQLQDYEVMVRRRLFQDFSLLLRLSPVGTMETTAHSTVLPLAVASFSDVDYFAPSSLSAAIASAAAAFETIWDVVDNYAFGLTGLVRGLSVIDPVLAEVAESAGLNFSAYVSNSIGMLSRLYVSDSHNVETAALASSNMAMELPVTAAIARGVDSVINVLGPDLQDVTKAREMILALVRLFSQEEDVGPRLESLRCLEHLSLYAPGYSKFALHVHRLQSDIESDSTETAESALHELSALMRRDTPEVIRTARPGLEERLWDYLNSDPDQADIKTIFANWLHQTGPSNPTEWIQRCNTILTRTKAKAEQPKTAVAKDTAAPELQDEEVAGFAAGIGSKEDDAQAPTSTQELMRWQVRLFAMGCLHDLIAIISKEAAINDDGPGVEALQQRVADVVRIAFSASTAGVAALRVVGMRIIDQILKLFGRIPDPDFPEAMLLEQYQAQISSALTPAFAADSSPELAAAAVSVCATFIATGIVTDIDRMGRILKVLVSALESFSNESESASIGDLQSPSANAQVMVRMAVFAAWAQLQIASAEQKYLLNVVKPHIAQLVPLWLASLREYSRLRFEPDISASLGGASVETLLGFYADAWLSLVDAIASLIDEDSEVVFEAMDGKSAEANANDHDGVNGGTGIVRKSTGINYREEPVAFFFVLFGLAFGSLAVRSTDDEATTRQRNLEILQALKKILRPSVSGNAVYQEVVFSETVDLLSRMVLTESFGVQFVVVEIARNLCLVHPSSRQGMQTPINGEALSDDIEQLFELTRIIVLVLGGLIPGLSETPVSVHLETSEEATALVRTALQALVEVSEVFPPIIKTDLHATILHIFVTILGTGACQATIVPQALPIFRRFLTSVAGDGRSETQSQLRNALARMLLVLRNAQKRETSASLQCEKSTLLAITVLLSITVRDIGEDDPLLDRFIGELAESLGAPMTSRVAAGCIRTLLLAGVASAPLVAASTSFLAEGVDLEGLEEGRTLTAQSLTTFASRVPTAQRPAAVALFTNALLERASKGGSGTYQETGARMLDLAAADNASFRAVISAISGERKALLERILKARAGVQRGRSDMDGEREPAIALKMNFGG
ncbi:hypothetical protein LTR32_005205 [Rachicladosporium monterosium]|uniref:LAA1-like C-terminal TPR repeats domain-containing protein n=1 Tax=Rachicladosporium monterosium TaxID=1507873 RepID=A0ABR0L2E2_9PEZI|nr:hypothetical protein LTR32_005205 [Rachicladosporium monterosium]